MIAAVLLVGALGATTFAAERRPNILLVLADDLGYSDLGCYGSEIRTPNIDGLAARGLRFTQFYNGTRCCPSRAALMTGLYPHQAGVGEMTGDAGPDFPGYRGRLDAHTVTIAERLRAAGYGTYMVGKWHLNADTGPIRRGFGEFYGMIGGFNSCWQEHPFFTRLPAGRPTHTYASGGFYSTDVFADYALDLLADARKAKDRPWFLYLAFNAPHFPLHAPEEDIRAYEQAYIRGWDSVRAGRLDRMKVLGLMPEGLALPPRGTTPRNAFNGRTGWADREIPAWSELPPDRRADLARRMAVYAAMVTRLDRAVGRVVADLREHGELDDTLILVLSDNGACAEWDPFGFDGSSGPNNVLHRGDDLRTVGAPGSYVSYGSGWANASNTPFRLFKHYGHEGGIRTPLVVHWPARIRSSGELRTQPGHIIDVWATCAEVAGGVTPPAADGRPAPPSEGTSLVPAFADRPLARDQLAWEHEGHRAIRVGDWKLVARAGGPWELYDLATDPVEMNDRAAAEPARVNDLAARWESWARRVHAIPRPGGRAPKATPPAIRSD